MQSCWVGGLFGIFFVPDKVSWRYFLTAQVNVLNLFFPFWGLCRQIPQQHLMIRSDSSSRDIFKSYLQCVPSGPTKEQSFSEQYILVILFFFFGPFRDKFSSSVSCKYPGLHSDKTVIKALGALPGKEQARLLRGIWLEKGFALLGTNWWIFKCIFKRQWIDKRNKQKASKSLVSEV